MRRSARHLLHDYVTGELDPELRRELEQRLGNDPGLRRLLDETRAAHEALACLRRRPEPPLRAEDAVPRIQAAIASAAFERRPKLYLESGSTRFYRRLAMAATLLLGVTFGVFAYRAARPGAAPAPSTPEHADRSAPDVPVGTPDAGLDHLVDLGGRRGGISAEELFRLLDESGFDPSELHMTPVNNVAPAATHAEER